MNLKALRFIASIGMIVLPLALVGPVAGMIFDPGATEEMGEIEVVASLAPPLAPDAPNAVNRPEDMRCRHNEGKTDQVLLEWNDTNEGSADYELYREDINDAGWSLLTTVGADTCENEVCDSIDTGASNSIIYRYRTRAINGSDISSFSDICREPLVQDDPGNQFRVFYRLEPTECPTVEGDQTCTQNVTNTLGQNIHVMQMLATHEAFRQEYINIGFKDYALYNEAKPFPIDLYPCNNGCANGHGIQIPPANLETPNYNPATGTGADYEVFVVGHEAFHKIQNRYGKVVDPYYTWLIEGQARSTEDKSCIFPNPTDCTLWDNEINKYYAGAVESYLGFPEQGLLDASYIAAFFWTYIVEQFGTTTSEPDSGMDALVRYWMQNQTNDDDPEREPKDGIGTLNDMFEAMGSPRRFKDVFQDFALANYLKEYFTNPPPAGFEKYNYIDEESYVPTGFTHGAVKLTTSGPLTPDQSIFGTTSVQAWGARYFQFDPDPALPVINIEIDTLVATPHPLHYHLLIIDGGNVVAQWTEEGTSFEYTVDNTPGYDRIALVVTSIDNPVNFTYGFNLTDGLYIVSPTQQHVASVGEATSPEKFILQVQVLDETGDPMAGIDTSEFTITVGSTVINPPATPGDLAIVGSSYIAGQYWLTLRAPSAPGCSSFCDLTVAYSAYADTELDAILYGPKPDTDNMIIIDRSGSMVGEKIVAAQQAAKLYADSYSPGDRIGVLSFNTTPNVEYALTDWTEGNRDDVAQAIDNIETPFFNTANGAALREGNTLLAGQSSPNPRWAMVLLSDGVDTVGDTNDHIAAYVEEWDDARDAGAQVPIVHVVAVGDDADGVELSRLTDLTGGLFQFLPVPSETGAVASSEAVGAVNLAEALAEIYRVFAEEVLDEQQTYVSHFPVQADIHTDMIQVDSAASQAIFVLKYSPPDAELPTVFLFPPSGTAPADAIPPTLEADGHLLWRIPEPEAGAWRLSVRFGCEPCPQDYMVESALISDLTMNAFLGLPVEERIVGKPMPIIAFLSDIDPLTGAVVNALSETTGEGIKLYDDGLHGDGAANDGAYGGTLLSTNRAGGYTVVIDASGTSPFAGDYTRRTRLGFYLPDAPDRDDDRLPDWWEIAYSTDPNIPDADQDPDGDDLPNFQEYFHKTYPLDPDTDDGGERDGSEVNRGADPLMPRDDGGVKPSTFKPWPGPKIAILRLIIPKTVDGFVIERAPTSTGPFTVVFSDTVHVQEWIDPRVENDQPYCYRVITREGDYSATSRVQCTTPKGDPNPPHGIVTSLDGNTFAVPTTLPIRLDASDNPTTEEHPAFDGRFLFPDAEISGVAEMMISNRADFERASWEPYVKSKMWTLESDANGQAIVFALFKDAAGNISDVAYETFTVDASLQSEQIELFLPSIGS